MAASALATGGDYLICRQVLAAQRKAGATFDEAWQWALKMVSPEDRTVLQETRHAWACAYARQPFHSGASFGHLAAVTVHDDDVGQRHDQRIVA